MFIIETLATKRLLLRAIGPQDLSYIHQMRKDPVMIAFTDSKLDHDLSETSDYLRKMEAGIKEKKWYLWAIHHQEEDRLIGTISLWNLKEELGQAELGYGIVSSHQNKGYMSEALAAITAHAFDVLSFSVLEAYTEATNLASIHLLEKLGFKTCQQVVEDGYYVKRPFVMQIYRKQK